MSNDMKRNTTLTNSLLTFASRRGNSSYIVNLSNNILIVTEYFVFQIHTFNNGN